MYADYLKEHRGDHLIENEFGFAVYRFLNETQVYIVDIYVVPEQRKSHEASTIADAIVVVAKARGCSELLGTVVPSANKSTESLKVLLGYGMRLKSASDDLIIFSKGI
jgi:hypothetical protein